MKEGGVRVSASHKRVRRLFVLVGTTAAATVLGLSLMGGPASATEGDAGSIDTSQSTVQTQPGIKTQTETPDCEGDKCKKTNWCGKGGTHGPAADAPVVLTDKGTQPPCVEYPKLDYRCCVPDNQGTADVVVKGHNPNKYGKYKIKVWLGNGTPIVKWIGAGQTVEFRFEGVGNGSHTLNSSIWAGGNTWCDFKPKTIKVKCVKPSHSPSKPPVTSTPSASPSTSASPQPSTSTSPQPSTSASTPPASESPSPQPSESESEQPVPGGGGGEPELPVTGAQIGTIAGGGASLVALGGFTLFALHRRKNQFVA